MENNKYKNADENPIMIVLGILCLYFLVVVFIIYLSLLHRISTPAAVASTIIFSVIYIPRFWILKKLKSKDIIKISENSIQINNIEVGFSEIEAYWVEEKKPQVIFFLNSKMVIFQEAIFHLKLTNGGISFNAIGSEKISLLKSFLDELIRHG